MINKDNLKKKVKTLKCMQGLLLLRRLRKDEGFRTWIDDYYNSSTVLNFHKYGDLNPNVNIYYMKFDSQTTGFFSYWWNTIMGLSFCEKYHLTPVVDWTSNSAYYEENGYNGIYNPFEYYYQPLSDIKVDDVMKSESVVLCTPHSRGYSDTSYKLKTNAADFVGLNKKYIKLRPEVEKKIMSDINSLLKKRKTLAVHVRGVEWGNIKNHPIPIGLDNYTSKIDEALEQYGFEQIFLATDSEDTIEYMKNKYNDKIVFYDDVARASKGSKTLALYDNSIERENNHYLLGIEVLRDMMTLASCDGIIASHSNISMAADITKKCMGKEFIYQNIFDTKINQSGISTQKAVKKMKSGKFDKKGK